MRCFCTRTTELTQEAARASPAETGKAETPEADALEDLLSVNENDLWTPLIDSLTVEPDYGMVDDVTDTLKLAVEASGCDSVEVVHKPRCDRAADRSQPWLDIQTAICNLHYSHSVYSDIKGTRFMTASTTLASQAETLTSLLGLSHPPLAITFSAAAPEDVVSFDKSMPEPTPDGRTGRVAAGCVFWVEARDKTFTTVAEDHGNCSVGSLTHGFKTLEEAATGADIAALVESEWVSPEVFPHIPTVAEKPGFVTYGPLAEASSDPDVVFIRLNGKQAMMLHDAWPDLRVEGKPQCHIIPIAKDGGEIALSVGCMLSRVRTGMSNNEMTCAIPAGKLGELLDRLGTANSADMKVAAYASADAKRFA